LPHIGIVDEQHQLNHGSEIDVFSGNASLDIADKKQLVQLLPPEHINLLTGDVSFKSNPALSKILETSNVV